MPSDENTHKIFELLSKAKEASGPLGRTTTDERNDALRSMAQVLRENSSSILAANKEDMKRAQEEGMAESLIDRLMLNEARIEDMACALENLVDLPDPLGVVQVERKLYNGIALTRVSVPLGVVGVIYEARPNVTADAAGICIKSGNACVLRGGSAAQCTNECLSALLSTAAERAGLPEGSINYIKSIDREAVDVLLGARGLVDVIIPRGGASLIEHCVGASTVPVIETGTGNCHIYVHQSADPLMARDIVLNAKCRRYGVCNAAETMLVDAGVSDEDLGMLLGALTQAGVHVHADEYCAKVAHAYAIDPTYVTLATDKDWGAEYLSADIAVKQVQDIDEAIAHVNTYGTNHSEAIVATDKEAQERFLSEVDAAAVYVNASTAFTDGGQFGLGAEIGISTQKLHVRGPFALEALTSMKYLLRGDGQIRA